jgi:CheY-like chemotaxis protein
VAVGTVLDGSGNMSEISRQSRSAMGSVLVVDDDDDVREGLCDLLISEGYSVKSACDGAEALVRLEQGPADLVLLDLRMPGMDGYEFLRQRESSGVLKSIPVMVVSASTDDKKFEFEGVSTLRKPVRSGTLLHAIHEVLVSRWTH